MADATQSSQGITYPTDMLRQQSFAPSDRYSGDVRDLPPWHERPVSATGDAVRSLGRSMGYYNFDERTNAALMLASLMSGASSPAWLGVKSVGQAARMTPYLKPDAKMENGVQFFIPQAGRITAAVDHDNGLVGVGGAYVQDALQGQGYGKALYKAAVDHAHGLGYPLTSDMSVSSKAARMYEGMARRGYDVEKLPGSTKWHASKDRWGWDAPDGHQGQRGVFTVNMPPRASGGPVNDPFLQALHLAMLYANHRQ